MNIGPNVLECIAMDRLTKSSVGYSYQVTPGQVRNRFRKCLSKVFNIAFTVELSLKRSGRIFPGVPCWS